MVGVTFTRNIFSTIFVFALSPWIAAMGLMEIYILIGVLLTAVLLGTFGFIFYGKQMRFRNRNIYRYYAVRQFEARTV